MSSQKQMSVYFPSFIGSTKLIPYQEIQVYHSNIIGNKDLFDKLIDQDYFLFQENSSIKTNQEINTVPQLIEHQGCKCSKTKCLKMYCECFSKEKLCTDKCECVGCFNTEDYQKQILNAQEKVNCKHPGLFKEASTSSPIKRCTCKKSGCNKKYCQCYRSKVRCSQDCQCLDCRNGKPHQHENFMDSSLPIEVNV